VVCAFLICPYCSKCVPTLQDGKLNKDVSPYLCIMYPHIQHEHGDTLYMNWGTHSAVFGDTYEPIRGHIRPVCGFLWLSAPVLRLLPCCDPLRVLCLSWARSRCCGGLSDPLTVRPAKITPHPLGGSCPGSSPVASSVPLSGSLCSPWVSALLLSLRGSVAHPVACGGCPVLVGHRCIFSGCFGADVGDEYI